MMMLAQLMSEQRHPESYDLDTLSTLALIQLINKEDAKVAAAVNHELPAIAQAVDKIAPALQTGGRLIYMGAGTSGRLGVLDASECPPTFGVSDGLIIGIIAGGDQALRKAVEGAEDSEALGKEDLQRLNLTAKDVVVGLAVSGRTPYVIGGLAYAKQLGCLTLAISCNPQSVIAKQADIAISPLVGPEVLTGSTRMKSGTAQKMVLNLLSTSVMVKLGKVYQNLMVDVQASNEKLVDRAIRIVMEATGSDHDTAKAALVQTQYAVKPAILMVLTGMTAQQAQAKLAEHQGHLRAALA